jgi:hypothetical protein
MRIQAIIWERVTVTCESHPEHSHVFKEAQVMTRQAESDLMVSIQGGVPGWDQASPTYAKAELLELTPWSCRLKAHYWFDDNGSLGLIPLEISCEFDLED